jgi:hypothetical protein
VSHQLFNHVRVTGKNFTGEGVSLDNMRYENGHFKNCQIFYSGGPVEMVGCTFQNVTWALQGAAALTYETLRNVGWLFSQPTQT